MGPSPLLYSYCYAIPEMSGNVSLHEEPPHTEDMLVALPSDTPRLRSVVWGMELSSDLAAPSTFSQRSWLSNPDLGKWMSRSNYEPP